jgi:hypothetical protein
LDSAPGRDHIIEAFKSNDDNENKIGEVKPNRGFLKVPLL